MTTNDTCTPKKSNVHVPYEKHSLGGGYVVSYLPSYVPQHLGTLMKQTIQVRVCATGTKYKNKNTALGFCFKKPYWLPTVNPWSAATQSWHLLASYSL